MMIGVIRVRLFIDRLIEKVRQKNSHVCVGLDPHLNLIPPFLFRESRSITDSEESALAMAVTLFNQIIIDHIADIAVAVKPQMAFYELLGFQGMIALRDTISYAREKGLIVILDGKRNDIGSTAAAYAATYLTADYYNPYCRDNNGDNSDRQEDRKEDESNFNLADALTVNPYLGFDGIEPFLQRKDKGAFSLLRTSNNSAGEFQDLELKDGSKLYQYVGKTIENWGKNLRGDSGYSNLGAVVGATYPEELKYLRASIPHTYFLIPGFGVQGGTVEDIVHGFDKNNLGALINSARGIIFAYRRDPWQNKYNEFNFAQAARMAVLKMRNDINNILH